MKKIKLILAALYTIPTLAQATDHSYTCKALSEPGVGTPIFSNLTLKISDEKIDVTGFFTGIGSIKTVKIKTTAIRKLSSEDQPNSISMKYNISNPFTINVFIPKLTLTDAPTKLNTTFGFADGDNGYVKASGTCTLKL